MQGGEDTERHVSRREMSIPAHICRTPLHSQGYKRGGYYGNGCKSSTKKGEGWMDVKEGTAHDAFKLSKRKPRQFHPREKVSNPAAGRGWGRAGPEPSPQRPGRDLLSCPSDHPGCSARHAHGERRALLVWPSGTTLERPSHFSVSRFHHPPSSQRGMTKPFAQERNDGAI